MKHRTHFVNRIKLIYLRNKAVQSQKTDLQHWKDDVSYRKRWIVETIFSCIKRMFGQYVTAIILDLKI
jgi:transposase